ncbi:MAG: ATP-grasp domain-containing protein, partial [Ignavibacteria bacterium]|nr:ATP-grasp domain-containing protein [Ignavibacteria bacterium]
MLALAASNWDIKTHIMDTDEHCPASSVCTKFFKGSRHDFKDVYNFGQTADMITYEIEDINIEALLKLKSEGKKILPDPEALVIIQDKGLQKEFYSEHGIPASPFVLYKNKDEITEAAEKGEIKIPFVQKLRKGGYDGRGVQAVKTRDELKNLLDGPSVIEEMIDIQKEISIIAARNAGGEIKCFPAVEMEFNAQANLVENLICPSSIDEITGQKAKEI